MGVGVAVAACPGTFAPGAARSGACAGASAASGVEVGVAVAVVVAAIVVAVVVTVIPLLRREDDDLTTLRDSLYDSK
jgi:hypothetical protein